MAGKVSNIIFDGGLQLTTGVTNTDPGRMKACKNFEQNQREGYTKIQGMRSYSGQCVFNVGDSYIAAYNGEYVQFLNGATMDLSGVVTWGQGGFIDPNTGTVQTYSGRCRISTWCTEVIGDPSPVMMLCDFQGKFPEVGDQLAFKNVAGGDEISATLLQPLKRLSDLAASDFSTVVDVNGYIPEITTLTDYAAILDRFSDLRGSPVQPAAPNNRAAPVPSTSPYGYTCCEFYFQNKLHVIANALTINFTAGAVEIKRGDTFYFYWQDGIITGVLRLICHHTVLTTGAWSDGTAVGYVVCYEDVTFNATDRVPNLSLVTQLGLGSIGLGTTYAAVDSYRDGVDALMWRDTGTQNGTVTGVNPTWELVDLGYELRFNTGSEVFQIINRLNKDTTVEADPPSVTAWTIAGTGSSNTWIGPTQIQADDGTRAQYLLTAGANTPTGALDATNFGFSIPVGAVITGIEVRIDRSKSEAAGAPNVRDLNISLIGIEGISRNLAKQDNWPALAADAKVVYGSDSDTWDVSGLSGELVATSDFGVRIIAQNFEGSAPVTANVDVVEMRIHYREPTARVYIRDTVSGTDVATADVVYFYKDKGDFDAGNDAEGVLSIANLSVQNVVQSGMQIRSAAGGAGTLYALTASTMQPITCPSSTVCENHNGAQYGTVQGNFYGSDETDQVFGVSGASFAWSFDGRYFIRIRTGLVEKQDKPRHVGKHLLQLALGFSHGEVAFSDPGYPESYAGVYGGSSASSTQPGFVTGASVVACGDAVTGITPLNEQSMGIFCQNSIIEVLGTGTGIVPNTISPNVGCVEYSLTNFGGPHFLSHRGVESLETTEAFGKFVTTPVSDDVTPWLGPRIQQTGDRLKGSAGFIRAELVRAKNQVRFFFRDRKCMTMTLRTGLKPSFTFQETPIVVMSSCHGRDDSGRDHVFYGTYHGASDTNELFTAQTALDGVNNYVATRVYEADIGCTWDDLLPIDGYFDVSIGTQFGSGVLNIKRFDRMVVNGLAYGYAPLGVQYGQDFGDIYESDTRNATFGYQTDAPIRAFSERPYIKVVSIAQEGAEISMRFLSDGETYYDGNTAPAEGFWRFRPPTIQGAVVIYTDLADLRF